MKHTCLRSLHTWLFTHATCVLLAVCLLPGAARAELSPIPAHETVIFSDDFDNNNNGWSNIGPANNEATIDIDPQLPGITAWYPSVGTASASFPGVYSMTKLTSPPNLFQGAVSIYMRARVWNLPPLNTNTLGENNKFTLVLAEDNATGNAVTTTATNALGQLIIKPQFQPTRYSKIGYAWPNSLDVVNNQLEVDLPLVYIFDATNYADYRLTFWATNVDRSMTLRAYIFNTNTLTWEQHGPDAPQCWLGSGIFDVLQVIARNAANTSSRSNNVRSFFDSVAVSYYGFTNLPPSSAWYIYNLDPTDGKLFAPPTGISFNVGAYEPNSVPQSAIKVYLNKQDITGSVNITGNNTNWLVTYNGLQANRTYEVKVVLTDDQNATRERVWAFSTFTPEVGKTLDLEDYNYGLDGFCAGSAIDVTLPTAGGSYIEGGPGYYQNLVGLPGADYFDFSTTNNRAGNNAYRSCEMMSVRTAKDELHEPFLTSGGTDYDLSHVGLGEWVNLTRISTAGVYRVYLRAAAIKPQMVYLDRVIGSAAQPAQVTQPVGVFHVPYTGSSVYRLVPLTDLAGNEVTVAVEDLNTWRITFSGQVNSIWPNFLWLVPDSATPKPIVCRADPAPGATYVDRHTSIKAQVTPGQAPITPGSVNLWVDGVNVTASTVSTIANGTYSLEYLPPEWFAAGSTHSVAVTAADSGGAVSNYWTFTASPRASFGAWRVNFQPATTIAPPGYLADTGLAYGDRGAGNFYGWDSDSNNVVKAQETLSTLSPTFAHDSYNLFNALPGLSRAWEFALPAGLYEIYAVAGDPAASDAGYELTAEGAVFLQGAPAPGNPFVSGAKVMEVTDGKLTIAATGTDPEQKINFLEITPVNLQISAPALSGAGFSVSFPTQPRRPYSIQYKAALGDGWSTAGTALGDGSVQSFTDSSAVGQTARYYRVVAE